MCKFGNLKVFFLYSLNYNTGFGMKVCIIIIHCTTSARKLTPTVFGEKGTASIGTD